jgi:polysaccharide export outer membrane protein
MMRCLIGLSLMVAAGLLVADAPRAAEPEPVPVGDDQFVIGAEDVLRIVVWGETELSLQVRVRPDGRITVPLVNEIDVIGLTPMQVRDEIQTRLAKFIRDPNVTVIVDEINSFRVYFLGEVTVQGALTFAKPPRILQGIAEAGGLSQFSKKEIIILRQQGGVEKRFLINYKHLIAGDPREENIYLEAGDTLIFP